MAVDVCSEIPSLGASPRISFSHDLKQAETVPVEHCHRRSDASLLDPNFDFNFCIGKSFTQELPSADELFSNGKILPIEIKKKVQPTKESQQCEPILIHTPPRDDTKKKRLKEFLWSDFDAEEEVKPLPKSFWQFRRSSSLDCESGRSKSLIRSLQFLSRSNSTGSAPNPKPTVMSKHNQKQHSFKQPPPPPVANSQSSSSSYGYYPYNSSKRPPLKKNCRSYSNGGVRISPVLNIPHNCIAKGTVSLFGLGSFFCNGKAKKKKK